VGDVEMMVIHNDAFNAGKTVQICVTHNDEMIVNEYEPLEALKYANQIIEAAVRAMVNKNR
jgi:hypothetical protein